MDGALLGDWGVAISREIVDPETGKKVDALLGKKYGIQKTLFAWAGRLRGDQNTILLVEFPSP
jgi:hypothetical protein